MVAMAQASRRSAMADLASAVEQERSSVALEQRSRDLIDLYQTKPGGEIGQTYFHARKAFCDQLVGLSRQAGMSRKKAEQRAADQASALAIAEQRLRTLTDKAEEARTQISAAQARRDNQDPDKMARKLLK